MNALFCFRSFSNIHLEFKINKMKNSVINRTFLFPENLFKLCTILFNKPVGVNFQENFTHVKLNNIYFNNQPHYG